MANFFELVGEIAVQGAQASERAIGAVNEKASTLSDRFDHAGKRVSAFGDRLSGIGDRASRFSGLVAGIGAGAALYVNSVTEAAEETLNWSRRLDINIESLQVWQRVAERFGIQSDALIDGFKELSLRADEFAQTGMGPAAEVFDRLGLSQDQVAAVKDDTEALFELVLARIRNVQGAAARQRILDELFGGQAAEQFGEIVGASADEVQAMKDDVRALGGIFTEEEAEQAREFNNTVSDLGTRLAAVGQRIISEFLPQIQSFVDALSEKAVPFIQDTVDQIQSLIGMFSSLPGPVQKAIGIMAAVSVAFGPVLSIVGRLIGLFGTLLSGIGALSGVFSTLMGGALVPLIPIILKVAAVAGALWLAWQAGKVIINWLLDNIPGIAEAIMDVIPSFDQISGAFRSAWNGMKSILSSMASGFTSTFKSIASTVVSTFTSMVSSVVSKARDMWNEMTRNSIIPDMANDVISEFNRMGESGEDTGERMRRGLTDAMADVDLGDVRGAGRGRGGDGSRVVNVDMSHSTIRDDRDMLDRLRRSGADISGAFA